MGHGTWFINFCTIMFLIKFYFLHSVTSCHFFELTTLCSHIRGTISFIFSEKAKSYEEKNSKNLAVYKLLHATVYIY